MNLKEDVFITSSLLSKLILKEPLRKKTMNERSDPRFKREFTLLIIGTLLGAAAEFHKPEFKCKMSSEPDGRGEKKRMCGERWVIQKRARELSLCYTLPNKNLKRRQTQLQRSRHARTLILQICSKKKVQISFFKKKKTLNRKKPPFAFLCLVCPRYFFDHLLKDLCWTSFHRHNPSEVCRPVIQYIHNSTHKYRPLKCGSHVGLIPHVRRLPTYTGLYRKRGV